MLDVVKLYPQYNMTQDRRQQKVSVPFERRSGVDRRSDNRVKLDTNLTRDIFEVRSKISQMQKVEPQKTEKLTFSQNISKAAQHSGQNDKFIKTIKPDINKPKPLDKKDLHESILGGAVASIFGGAIASTLCGAAAVGIALGLGVYLCGKLMKNAIALHIKKK